MKLKWPKRILIALAVLIALAALLPLFVSLDDYIPRIEKEASARIRQPVSIKRIRLSALPWPHVTIEDIRLGKADELTLGQVKVTPALLSLLQTTRVISSVEIDSMVVTRKAIDMITALAAADAVAPPQPQAVRVELVRLENVTLRLDKTDFGPFDARLTLDAMGKPQDVSITTRDGKLKATITPDKSNYLIDVSARAWTLPAGPALLFDELQIRGVATPQDARLDEVSARLYGGTVLGKMNLGWQKGLRIEGKLDIGDLELRLVASLLSPGARIGGKLSAKPVFSAAAPAADKLAKALRLETDFRIRDGVLHGVDIQQAATQMVKKAATGGETRFDQLSGHLLVTQGSRHLSQLQIASGALAADGAVSISPQKVLSGRINAQVKLAGVGTKVPLNVSGTLDSPMLYPTGATIAGAAVGTAVMGPGFGTSVGAKVGGWAEGLFDSKPQPAPKR
jgi:uncharacterized protein involved in outer membrane biogenesis